MGMNVEALAEASAALAATPGRLRKVEILSACLRALPEDEQEAGVAWLSGSLRQGRLGLGPSLLGTLRRIEPAGQTSLTVAEVDAAFTRIEATRGQGSTGTRRKALESLFRRATRTEQAFLLRLLLGELRQGALEGVMAEAISRASGLAARDVHRAIMLSGGDLGRVAATALSQGQAGLDSFRLRLYEPLKPMLASPGTDVAAALSDLGTAVLEYKIDGARVQIHKGDDGVRIYSRTGRDVTASLPELREAFEQVRARSLIVDGETIALRGDGRPRPFQDTMRRFGRTRSDPQLRKALPLSVFCFDCLHAEGSDLIDRPTEERIAALDAHLAPHLLVPRLVTADVTAAEGFLRSALDSGHEGVMAKAADATYAAGRRGAAWLKIKVAHTLDLVVLAAEWGSGRRSGWLSNLHLGARDTDGRFVMLGKTFKGMTDDLLAWQTQELLARSTGTEGRVVHVRPELVVEIAFNELQVSRRYPGGLALRFARVLRYRDDKSAADADTIATVRALAGHAE